MKKYKCPFCGTELTTDEKPMLELYNFSCNICDIMITVNPDKPETECITGRPGDSVLDIILRGMRRKMKKYNCPKCKKELIRLEPYNDGVYNYWCDTCNIDICITNNNEVEKDQKEDFKNRVDAMIEYHDANARLITINKILYNETLDKYFKNYHGFNKRILTSDTITYYHDCDADEGFNKEYVIKVEPERDRIYISKLEKYKSDKVTKPIFVRSWNIGNLYSEDIDYLVNRIIDLCLGPDYAHKHAKEVGKRFEDE